METTYKFFRMWRGIASFAQITVDTRPCAAHELTWNATEVLTLHLYRDAIALGVEAAHMRHCELGGETACVTIVDFVDVMVDTKADAVTCAAALATWKALGHDEAAAVVEYRDEWTVSFA